MSLRIRFDEKKLGQGLYQKENEPAPAGNGASWPKDTWFRRRLRYVREQQRKKTAEAEIVYECALGTIIIRQSNGGN